MGIRLAFLCTDFWNGIWTERIREQLISALVYDMRTEAVSFLHMYLRWILE
jgi:hypothetical protein